MLELLPAQMGVDMNATTALEEVKARQQKVWSSGDYGKVGWLTVPLGDLLCEAVSIRPGATVLDVATGTGNVALAAARRFCTVTGIDYVPALITQGQRRAGAEALAVDFREADAEQLPFEDGSFDYVLSAVGVMFTADHPRAGAELVRVCRPGGRVGIANWTPAGFAGQMLRTVGRYAPPPPGAQPPTRWGTPDQVREYLPGTEPEFTTTTVTQRFRSPEHFADFLLANYGPTLKASQQLSEEDRRSFRDDLIALATEANRVTDGTFVADWELLVTVATKR
jgi:SAM-dependent methyltransferase